PDFSTRAATAPASRELQVAPVVSRIPPVMLNLAIRGNRVTGTVIETNRPGVLTIEDGVLANNTFTFKTRRTIARTTEILLWKGEVVDGQTIFLFRTLSVPERKAGSTGPGLPGQEGGILPDDVKRTGGALVLRRKQCKSGAWSEL